MNIKSGIQRRYHRLVRRINFRYRIATSRWRKLPDFIIIGTQKGGTTSLFYYLYQHPELNLSYKKEIYFFNLYFEKGLSWYKSHFPLRINSKITGEATPSYLFHPKAARRAKSILPDVKLIVLLRNPIDRAYSGYAMGLRRNTEPLNTFEATIKREFEALRKQNATEEYTQEKHNLYYLERGKYYSQLSWWLKHFQREQFLFIKSENFFQNPESELIRVYKYLGISTILPDDLSKRNVGKYDKVSSETVTKLDHYFKEENQKLIDLLGEEFSWEIDN